MEILVFVLLSGTAAALPLPLLLLPDAFGIVATKWERHFHFSSYYHMPSQLSQATRLPDGVWSKECTE